MKYLNTGSELTDAAHRLALELHANQLRRNGTTPYAVHLADVWMRLKDGADEVLQAVARLHDSVEDGHTTLEELHTKHDFPEEVVNGVDTLTRRSSESYTDFIVRVKTSHSGRFVAVKVADILANLSDDPTPRQIRRYALALLVLVDAESE